MEKSWYREDQFVRILSEAQSGKTILHLLKEHGVWELTFYTWRKKYSGLADRRRGQVTGSGASEQNSTGCWPTRCSRTGQ